MAGWKEPNCSSPCDPGSHAYGCRKNCNCLNDASCDPTSGSCNCTPGWTGSYCNVTCPAGRYGNDCLESCTCLERAECDPVNGICSCLPDKIGPNCTPIEESTTQQTKGKQESNPLGSDSNARLIGIVVSVVGGVSIIVAIVGGALWHISKHYRGFVKVRRTSFPSIRQNGNAISGGHGDGNIVLPIRFTDQREARSADELTQASSHQSLGQALEQVTDEVDVNLGLAAYHEVPTDGLSEGLPLAVQSRSGTARRNTGDRLPSTTPIARCSWSTDENAYSELGNYSIPTQKKAVPTKPSFSVRPYGRKVSPSTDGDGCSNDSYTWSREIDKHKPSLPIRQNQMPESVSAYAVNSIVEPTKSSIKKYTKPANRVRHTPKPAGVRNTTRSGAMTEHLRRFGEPIGSTIVTGETTKGNDTAKFSAIKSLPGEPVYFIVHPEPSSQASSDSNEDN